MATTAEKLTEYNELRIAAGQKPIKRWSKKVVELDAALNAAREAAAPKTTTKPQQRRTTKSDRIVIARVVEELIVDGRTNAEIHQHLMALKAEGKNIRYDESKKWYPAWYRAALKRKAAKEAQ